MAATLVFLAAALAQAPDRSPEEPRVASEVRVSRIILDAWVTGRDGEPLAGLSRSDFRVTVDGREAEVEAAEWIPADVPEIGPPLEAAGAGIGADPAPREAPSPPGRLLVVFVQGDIGRFRTLGTMHAGHHLGPLLDSLRPSDRVAVVSFDSHLKLRQDFTNDPAAIRRAFFASLAFGAPESGPAALDPGISIASRLDPEEALRAASVDRALGLVARALAPIPGGKAVLFFGWGLRVNRSPRETREYLEALEAIEKARVTVFSIDVTLADWHTLEEEMRWVSEVTGGTYESAFHFPSGAVFRLARRLAGRYVLVCVRPDLPAGSHRVAVRLSGREGTVTARTYTVDP